MYNNIPNDPLKLDETTDYWVYNHPPSIFSTLSLIIPCNLSSLRHRIHCAVEYIAQLLKYKDRLMVVKIDHDANPRLIEEYKVYGLPALILFKNGQEVTESRRERAITKAKLKEYIDSLLDSISV